MSKKSLDTSTKLLHDSILACRHSLEVKAIRQTGHTESLSFLKAVKHLGILAESLGRDASLIETCTAHRTSFNQHNLHSPLRSNQSCLISARSRTYYNYFHIDIK
jgi:hypothetical protein